MAEAQKDTFPFKGREVEVSSGNEAERAYIKYTEDDVNKEFHIDGITTSKAGQSIVVFFEKFFKDSKGNLLNQDIPQSFLATKQENTDYFYKVPADPLGLKLDQMCINGLLYELLGVICYSPEDGHFYPPITAEVEVQNATFTNEGLEPSAEVEIEGEESPFPKLSKRVDNSDGKITVTPVDIVGNPTFILLEKQEENEDGVFEDLMAGTYHIKISSDGEAMPSVITVKIDSVASEEEEEEEEEE